MIHRRSVECAYAIGQKLLPLSIAVVVMSLGTGSAAARPFDTGLLDPLFSSGDPGVRADALTEAKKSKAGTIRLNVFWRSVAQDKPSDASDPRDPSYDFDSVDAMVRDASAHGFRIMLTVTAAPNFAEGANRPASARPGSWKPSPRAYGQFARALATRYSGSFAPPLGGVLPRVRHYQAWNEGNLDVHLAPQYQGKKPFMPGHYRKMLNAFYKGVHGVQRKAKVITTGTAPYGDSRGGARTRPLSFWRKVFCLKGRRELKPKSCKVKPKLDVLAHHPINTSGGPKRSALHPDDASTPDFKYVRKILRKAERTHNIRPRGKGRPLWATELWWESKPPDKCGVGLKRHARYVRQSFKLLRRQGASVVIWLSLRDQPAGAAECGRESLQSGLTRTNGKRKPAFAAFRRFGR